MKFNFFSESVECAGIHASMKLYLIFLNDAEDSFCNNNQRSKLEAASYVPIAPKSRKPSFKVMAAIKITFVKTKFIAVKYEKGLLISSLGSYATVAFLCSVMNKLSINFR